MNATANATSFDLSSAAVGRASGDDAGTVLGALLETPGIGLVHEYSMAKAPAPAVPSAPGMGGNTKSRAAQKGQKADEIKKTPDNPVVPEYEVFRNDNNAVAFFMNRQQSVDTAGDDGPYFFNVHEGKNIVAGSENGQVFFADVAEDVIEAAVTRGVLLMVEFEEQKPIRCTPCYYMAE